MGKPAADFRASAEAAHERRSSSSLAASKAKGLTDARGRDDTAVEEFPCVETGYVDDSGRLQRAHIDTERLVR